MEGFTITIEGQEFSVKQSLHENLYEVREGGRQLLVGKRDSGEWEVMLQDSEQAEISAKAIGAAIEAHLKN